jgi:lactate dehydrogenase-like 2-hydroxyacid dehydrogenase
MSNPDKQTNDLPDRAFVAGCEGRINRHGSMPMPMKKYKIAVLDDYQNVALKSADWSLLGDRADITVFQDHLADPDALIERLSPFDVVCVMRERTPLPRNVIERLPNLKLIASTGAVNASIDVAAAGDHGIAVVYTGYRSDPTIEFTWALILASARHIVTESNSVRFGVKQPYARPGRGRGAGENAANGLVDQCFARADRRRASFDPRVEEQANRRRGDRRIRH